MSQTTNIQEIKEQIFAMIVQLKNLSAKCELLSEGHIGETKKQEYKCMTCYDTGQRHIEGSGWVDAPCVACG
jgi:hypothetical protein